MSQIESRDVLIDSSALFKVFRENLSSQLINWIKKENKRLIFSELVISEMIDNNKNEMIEKDFLLLDKLLSDLSDFYSAWIQIPEECIKMEMDGQIISQPIESDSAIKQFKSLLKNKQLSKDTIQNLDPNEKHAAKKWKEENYHQLDLNAQNKIALNPSSNPEIYYNYIINYNGPVVDSHFLEVELNRLNLIKGTKITTSQIIKKPSRFPFLYTLICFTELTALGNFLPRKNNDEIAVNLRSSAKDKGNWFDNNIATSASLCSLLLTEDKKFIWKCNYLYSKNLIQFRAKRISDILKF